MEYSTKLFTGFNGIGDAFLKYEEWLKQNSTIELFSVNITGKDSDMILVTYIKNQSK